MTPPAPPNPPPRPLCWTLSQALRYGLLAGAAIPLTAEAALAVGWPLAPAWVGLGVQHLTPVLAWGGCLGLLIRRYPEQAIAQLGWHWPGSWRARLGQTALGILGVLAIMALASVLAQWQTGAPLASPYEDFSREALHATAWAGLLLAPWVEECAFRGVLQPALAAHVPMAGAIGISATLFALSHALYADAPLALASVWALGLWFGWLRAHTGSLWPGILGHLLNNALAAITLCG